MTDDISVKGIVLSVAPQSEYNKRVMLITDRLGKICVFAQGAAKQGSRLIGKLRPMTMATFRLSKGRSAYNLHGIDLIDPFSELTGDLEDTLYGMYMLEAAEYYAQEGMEEGEARSMLNLLYVALSAMRKKELERELIRAVYELRLLVIEGEYEENPAGTGPEGMTRIWSHVIASPLSRLYAPGSYGDEVASESFIREAEAMFRSMCRHSFRSLSLL